MLHATLPGARNAALADDDVRSVSRSRCVVVACALGLAAVPAGAEEQNWLTNSASLAVGGGWSLRLTHERRATGLEYGGGFLDNGSVSLLRRLGAGATVAVGYLRESARRGIEDRLEVDAGLHRRLSDGLDLDTRLRLERREFARVGVADGFRGRLQLRLRSRARIGRLKLRPFVSGEVFADAASQRVSENRLILGTTLPAGPHADWLIGYLRQDARGRPSVHALNTGLDLRF